MMVSTSESRNPLQPFKKRVAFHQEQREYKGVLKGKGKENLVSKNMKTTFSFKSSDH